MRPSRDADGVDRKLVAPVARYCGYRVPGPLLVRVPSERFSEPETEAETNTEGSYAAVRVTFRSGPKVPAQGFRARYRFGRLRTTAIASSGQSHFSDIDTVFGTHCSALFRVPLFNYCLLQRI